MCERQVENMSRRDEYEQKAEAMLAPIVEGQGFELVDVEYDSTYFRENEF